MDRVIEKDIFVDALRKAYMSGRNQWCGFWKLKALALDKDTETFYIPEKDCYYAIYRNMLACYISNDEECHVPIDELNKLDCIAMPAVMFDKVKDKLTGFNVSYGFGLDYNWDYTPIVDVERYSTVEFDFTDEQHFIEASNMLNQKENGDWMMTDNIKKLVRLYRQHLVFEPGLWFFAKDDFEDKLVGIAISYFDRAISETQIDYFYVLPQFHKRGAGRFLLNETVNRCRGQASCGKPQAEYILSGGTNEFYKKCGFCENRPYVWAAKEGFEFVASCVQP